MDGSMLGEGNTLFHLFPFPPQQTLLKPSFFSFDLMVLFQHGFKPLFMPFFLFPQFINYDCTLHYDKSFRPSLLI
jgi:hypothetical protein